MAVKNAWIQYNKCWSWFVLISRVSIVNCFPIDCCCFCWWWWFDDKSDPAGEEEDEEAEDEDEDEEDAVGLGLSAVVIDEVDECVNVSDDLSWWWVAVWTGLTVNRLNRSLLIS